MRILLPPIRKALYISETRDTKDLCPTKTPGAQMNRWRRYGGPSQTLDLFAHLEFLVATGILESKIAVPS
jgi:hypothetical protein